MPPPLCKNSQTYSIEYNTHFFALWGGLHLSTYVCKRPSHVHVRACGSTGTASTAHPRTAASKHHHPSTTHYPKRAP
jgi:hypothetical protein